MYFLFVTVLANQFLPIPDTLYIIASALGLILFLVSTLWINRGFMQIASITALVVGHVLIFGYGLGFEAWHTSLTKGIVLPLLFVVIPLIAVPINNGGYLESMEHFVTQRRNRISQVFITLTLINLALTVTLNIASIIIYQRLLNPLNLPKRYLARLHMAVYGSYMMFSPYDPAINMILLYQNVPYAHYFFPALMLVAAIIGVNLMLILADRKLIADIKKQLPRNSGQHSVRKLWELVAHVGVLISLAFIGSLLLSHIPTIFIVAGIIVIYSIIWIAQIQAFDALKMELRKYNKNFDDYIQFLPFLISLSFFGSVVSLTPMRESLGILFVYLNELSPYFIALSFMLLVTMLSLCGIHMMIPVTTLALTVSPASLSLSPEAFIALLLASWVAGMVVSPFIPFTVVASSATQIKVTTFAYRWGLTMLIPWLIVAPAVIVAINYFTGSG